MLGREAIIEAILPNHNIPQRILAIRGGGRFSKIGAILPKA